MVKTLCLRGRGGGVRMGLSKGGEIREETLDFPFEK